MVSKSHKLVHYIGIKTWFVHHVLTVLDRALELLYMHTEELPGDKRQHREDGEFVKGVKQFERE